MGTPVDMIEWFRKNSVNAAAAAKLDPEELDGKIVIGEFYRGDAPEYTRVYEDVIKRAKEAAAR
jgi:2-oxoglutarate ferredoxin oxidoreductase subunit beta